MIVEHNLDLELAPADKVFALEHGAVFHEGPAVPLLADLERKSSGFDIRTVTMQTKKEGKAQGKVALVTGASKGIGQVGQPAEVANVVAFLAGAESSWMTGQVMRANGGWI